MQYKKLVIKLVNGFLIAYPSNKRKCKRNFKEINFLRRGTINFKKVLQSKAIN
jgi:hypothetical protein